MEAKIYVCTKCHAVANLYEDAKALNGWQAFPVVICSGCIDTEMAARPKPVITEHRSGNKVIRTLTFEE